MALNMENQTSIENIDFEFNNFTVSLNITDHNESLESEQLTVCDGNDNIKELIYFLSQNKWLIFAQSIIFDLIGGLLSSGFVYTLYQGIELAHPIYAVLFSNIIFSTVISFTSFVLSLFNITFPCKPILLHVWLNASVWYSNGITWMVTATLRYFLLVTKSENSEAINMPKLTIKALISNWSIILIVLSNNLL